MATPHKLGKIVTEHVFPPIPLRQFDWCATDDNYEPDSGYVIGWGRTEQEAIDDYKSYFDEQGEPL